MTAVGVGARTRLDDRYQLQRVRERAADFSVWRGWDELLKRTVAVQTFDTGFVPPGGVFEAVRAASQVIHAGLPQIYDANQDSDPPYVVREWIPGRNLAALVVDGPLDPHRTIDGFLQASETLATAHAAGLPHLRLTPQSLVWSSIGGVKVIGLGVDAAVARTRVEEPELADTRALGRLLDVALSGRYSNGSVVVRPPWSRATKAWWLRHVGAGRDLVAIAHRADPGSAHRSDAIRTPAEFAEALRRLRSDSPLQTGNGVAA